MLIVGLTVMLPSAGRLVPPLTDTLSASVVVQVKVADSPTVMVVGAAEKPSTVGGGGTVTVMDWALIRRVALLAYLNQTRNNKRVLCQMALWKA